MLAGVFALLFVTIGVADAAPGNVPSFSDGVINIYKRSNPGGTLTPGNGQPTTAGGDPLAGVVFTLYKVNNVDPTTTEGWDTIQKVVSETSVIEPVVDNADAPTKVTIDGTNYTLTSVASKETAATTGLASFTGLTQGLYVAVEGADNGNNNITRKAAPFYVVLPISDDQGNWIKISNAYPKNVVSNEPVKSVTADTLNDGKADTDGTLTWKVEQDLPTFDAASKPTSWKLVDDLSQAGDTTGTLASVKVTVGGTALAAADYTKALSGTTLTIELTASGLAKLTSDAKIAVEYTTVGKAGTNVNEAETFMNDASAGSDTAQYDLGKVVINKKDADNGKALEGAEFKICAVTAAGGNNTADCTPLDTKTTAGDAGTLSFENLDLGKYVVVETKAPVGYSIPANPVTEVTITAAGATVTLEIDNPKNPLPWLPNTGAQGRVLLTVGGIALLAAAAGGTLVVRTRRMD